jgi:hypothetical protein
MSSSSIETLYQQLKKESLAIDLTADQKEEFVKITKTLDETGCEIVYILIRVYELDTTAKSEELPYGSKFVNKELKFDLETLPTRLKWILYKFVKKHAEKMEEENIIDKFAKMHTTK